LGTKLSGFLRKLLGDSFFFGGALLVFDRAQSIFFASPCVFDLALALQDFLALAGLDQRTSTCVDLTGGELPQNLLRPLVATLLGTWFLEGTMLGLLRRGLLGLLRLFRHPSPRAGALALRFDQNGFRPAMAEILTDMALFDRPLHVQRHRLAASRRFRVRFFRFAHSLS
jgi:hypothetical protein